ncbi:type II toxin-antitoxin system HicB family antitoxin [Candidatus Gottesmanbacteria bacterium]|nr:type II toxin-antitoxin system HicB family antitoxin [Candidatus Gottesmanbacteria bacterium]
MKKNLNYYLGLDYTVRLKQNADGTYFAEIEELTGCISEGDTKEEALSMIEDAKRAWLEVALERKTYIPEPTTDEFSGKLNIRLPKYIHRKLSYRARQEGMSLNSFINSTLSSAVK